eukprot:m51a1_g6196 putative protein kinase domain containing protein (2047) ;mRNA; r:94734-101643
MPAGIAFAVVALSLAPWAAVTAQPPLPADPAVSTASSPLIWRRTFAPPAPGALDGLALLNPCARASPTTGALELLPGARARLRLGSSVLKAMSHGFMWYVGALPGAPVDATPSLRVALEMTLLQGADAYRNVTCRPACFVVNGDHSLVALAKTSSGLYDPLYTWDCACTNACAQGLWPRARGTSFSMGSSLNVSYGPWAAHGNAWADSPRKMFPALLSLLAADAGSTLLVDIVADGVCRNATPAPLPLMRVSGMEIRKTCTVVNCETCDRNDCHACVDGYMGGYNYDDHRPLDSASTLSSCWRPDDPSKCSTAGSEVCNWDLHCHWCAHEGLCKHISDNCSASCWSSTSAAACALSSGCRWAGSHCVDTAEWANCSALPMRACGGGCAWCPGERSCAFTSAQCASPPAAACAGLAREQCQSAGCTWCALTSSPPRPRRTRSLPLMRVSGMEIRKTCTVVNCETCDRNDCHACVDGYMGGYNYDDHRPLDSASTLSSCWRPDDPSKCSTAGSEVCNWDLHCHWCAHEGLCKHISDNCSASCWSSTSAAACALSAGCRWAGSHCVDAAEWANCSALPMRACGGGCAWCPGERSCAFTSAQCASPPAAACAGLAREQCQSAGCTWCALTSSCAYARVNSTGVDTLCSAQAPEAAPDPLAAFSGYANVFPDGPGALARVVATNALAAVSADGVVAFRPGGAASFALSREAVGRLARGFAVAATLELAGPPVRHTLAAHALAANGTLSECLPFCLDVRDDHMLLLSGPLARAYRWPLADAMPRAVTVSVAVGLEAVRVSVNDSVAGWFFTLPTDSALPAVASARRLVVAMLAGPGAAAAGPNGTSAVARSVAVAKACLVSHCALCDSEGACQRCAAGYNATWSPSSTDAFQRWCMPRTCPGCAECPLYRTQSACSRALSGCAWCALESTCKYADDYCAPDCPRALHEAACAHPNCTWRAVTPTAGLCVARAFTRDCSLLSATPADCTPAAGCLLCADGACRDNQTACERALRCDARAGSDECERGGACEWCAAVGRCVYPNGARVACAGAQQEAEWSNATGSRGNFYWKPFKAAYPYALSGLATANASFSRVLAVGEAELGVAPGGSARLAIPNATTRAMRTGFYALLRVTLPDAESAVLSWAFRALLANGTAVECAPLCLRFGPRAFTEVRSGGAGRSIDMPVYTAGLWRKVELTVRAGVIALSSSQCKFSVAVDPRFGPGLNFPPETQSLEVEFAHAPAAAGEPPVWLSEFYVEPTCQTLHCDACNAAGVCAACAAGYELVGTACMPPFNCSSAANASASSAACRACPVHGTADACRADANCSWCPYLAANARSACQWRDDYCPPNCPAVCSGSAECRDLCLRTPRCYWRDDTTGGSCAFMDRAAPCPAYSAAECAAPGVGADVCTLCAYSAPQCAAMDYSCGGAACASYGIERIRQCGQDPECAWCDATRQCTNETSSPGTPRCTCGARNYSMCGDGCSTCGSSRSCVASYEVCRRCSDWGAQALCDAMPGCVFIGTCLDAASSLCPRLANRSSCEAASAKLGCQWCGASSLCVAAGGCAGHAGGSLSGGAVAGIVIGVVAFVAAAAAIAVVAARRAHRRPTNSNVSSSSSSAAYRAAPSAASPVPLSQMSVVAATGAAAASSIHVAIEPERLQFREYDAQGGLAVDEFSEATFVIRNLSDAVLTCSVRAALPAELESLVEVAVDCPLGRFLMNPGLNETARLGVLPKCALSETVPGVAVVVWDESGPGGEYREVLSVPVPLDIVTRPSCKLDPRELVLGKELASGDAGRVFRASWRGAEVAVKQLPAGWYTPQQVSRELGELARLASPTVVAVHGAVTRGEASAVVMELAPLGSLADVLGTRELSVRVQLLVAVDCARALDAAHRAGLLHGFLKADNVLVFSLDEGPGVAVHAKVSDFGMERAVATTLQGALAAQFMGSLQYMAPEVLSARAFGPKADVYAFGLILWALASSREPYEGESDAAIEKMVSGGGKPGSAPEGCPYAALIEACWHHDPAKRPAMDEVLLHLTSILAELPSAPPAPSTGEQ